MLDVLVIGSGPAGLSAAIYAKRANLDVVVLEKEYCGTGQIAESSQVDNYLGLPGTNGYDLGERFLAHAESFGVEIREAEAASFEADVCERCGKNYWKTALASGEVIESKTVIYTAGAVHRHLGLPGETRLAGKGVSYCATCDGAFFNQKTVAVVGGGDTALDDALYLAEVAKKVYLIHRRDEFRGSAQTVAKLKERENVELVLSAVPKDILGEDKVSGIELEDGRVIELDGVFVAVGMIPMTQGLKDIVELDGAGYVKADETGITSAPGFFVAGDVRTKVLRQVVTAVSDGANAATSAEQYIK